MTAHERRTWHADTAALSEYLTGGAGDLARTASVETHLVGCGTCRARLARLDSPDPPFDSPDHPLDAALEGVWTRAIGEVQAPRLPAAVRLMRRAGLSDADAALLGASRSLGMAWLLSTTLVAVVAAVASIPGTRDGIAAYLFVAPLLPVLGVLGSYAATDPISRLTRATPYSKARLALLRSLAVTLTTVPVVVVAGAVGGIGWLAVVWLGPALGLTLAGLNLLAWVRPGTAASILTCLWAVVVLVARGTDEVQVAVAGTAQLVYLVVAAGAAVLLVTRLHVSRSLGGLA